MATLLCSHMIFPCCTPWREREKRGILMSLLIWTPIPSEDPTSWLHLTIITPQRLCLQISHCGLGLNIGILWETQHSVHNRNELLVFEISSFGYFRVCFFFNSCFFLIQALVSVKRRVLGLILTFTKLLFSLISSLTLQRTFHNMNILCPYKSFTYWPLLASKPKCPTWKSMNFFSVLTFPLNHLAMLIPFLWFL